MNTESPEGRPQGEQYGDEHGVWSEDMELAPVHPGDREPAEPGDRQGERLQKVLARAGVGSRRVCEDMIAEGRISVNGQQIREQGVRVDPQADQIAVDGQRLDVRNDRVTYAMNKPYGVVTTMSDDRGRPSVGRWSATWRPAWCTSAGWTRTPRVCCC
jgi:23S rRNA pseudouridine2605 synthase